MFVWILKKKKAGRGEEITPHLPFHPGMVEDVGMRGGCFELHGDEFNLTLEISGVTSLYGDRVIWPISRPNPKSMSIS